MPDTWSDFAPDCHTLPLNTQQQPCVLCVCFVYWYTSVNLFPSTMTHNSQLQTKRHSQDFKPLHLKVHSDGGSVAFLISVPAKPWSKKTFQKLFQLTMSDKNIPYPAGLTHTYWTKHNFIYKFTSASHFFLLTFTFFKLHRMKNVLPWLTCWSNLFSPQRHHPQRWPWLRWICEHNDSIFLDYVCNKNPYFDQKDRFLMGFTSVSLDSDMHFAH